MSRNFVAGVMVSAAVLLAVPGLAFGQSQGGTESLPLKERVQRLERILNSGTLLQLLDQVQALQDEVQKLRGKLEVDEHTLSEIKGRQRDLYLDLDRRLQRIEQASAAPGATGTGGETAAAAGASPPAEAQAGSGGGEGATTGEGAASQRATAGAAPAPGTSAPSQGASGQSGSAPPPSAPSAPAQASTSSTGQGEQQAAAAAAAAQPPASGADPLAEQRTYQAAFDLLKGGRYDQAVQAFQDFLKQYPGGTYADNAQYWLGETYYVTRRFEPALQAFQKLVHDYPNSQKLTHAQLKIGYIYDEMGKKDEAQKVLNDLVSHYPNSTAARLARERLQRIKQGSG